jgi:hypothetical protein
MLVIGQQAEEGGRRKGKGERGMKYELDCTNQSVLYIRGEA